MFTSNAQIQIFIIKSFYFLIIKTCVKLKILVYDHLSSKGQYSKSSVFFCSPDMWGKSDTI